MGRGGEWWFNAMSARWGGGGVSGGLTPCRQDEEGRGSEWWFNAMSARWGGGGVSGGLTPCRQDGQGVGQSVRSLKCPGQSVRRESQSVRRESQSVRGESQSVRRESQSVPRRSPPRSMCYKHRRSRPSGTYEPLAVGSIETYIFYFYLTSIHIIYKVAKPNHNAVGPGRID